MGQQNNQQTADEIIPQERNSCKQETTYYNYLRNYRSKKSGSGIYLFEIECEQENSKYCSVKK